MSSAVRQQLETTTDLPWSCPRCRTPLKFAGTSQNLPENAAGSQLKLYQQSGKEAAPQTAWECLSCNQSYPVYQNVPSLLTNPEDFADQAEYFDEYTEKQGDDNVIYSAAIPRIFQPVLRWNYKLRERVYPGVIAEAQGVILDIGCGTGTLSVSHAADASNHVVGLDLSRQMLRFAQQKHLQVAQASATEIPCLENSFDAIFCLGLIQYFDDPAPLLNEMKRVLKPEGKIYLATTVFQSLRRCTRMIVGGLLRLQGKRPQVKRKDTLKNIFDYVETAGLAVRKTHTVHFPLPVSRSLTKIRPWHHLFLSEVLLELEIASQPTLRGGANE